MPAIAYPSSLPGPSAPGGLQPRPRKAGSNIEGPLQLRARQRDFAGAISEYPFIYSPSEMAVWREWYEDDLLQGRRWFAVALPGRGGIVDRVARYLKVQEELLASGNYRVEATLEQRGVSAAPRTADLPPVVFSSGGGGGGGQTPTLPSQIESGTYLLLYVLVEGITNDVEFDDEWGDHIVSEQDSGGDARLHVYGRIADGTGADELMAYALSLGGHSVWAVVGFNNANDPAFPFDMAVNVDYRANLEGGGGINPNGISKSGYAAVVACAFTVGTYATVPITSDPTGYTAGANEIVAIGPFGISMRLAYKMTTAPENPDGFDYSGSAQSGALTVGVFVEAP
jgi:hypothetical protein